MILSCQSINKSFITQTVLKDASFHMEDFDKVAIVGSNGAGKTTLLRIITKELEADSGQVSISKGKTIGYLAQHNQLELQHTIYEELLMMRQDLVELEDQIRSMEANMKHIEVSKMEDYLHEYNQLTHTFEQKNGYAYKSELIGVLKGLGFSKEEFDTPVSTLSGGQKTRVALGKMLYLNPDLIILDEPTNHLDIQAVTWLENYLSNYKGAVIIVSHDRYFLDKVVQKVVEIENAQITSFVGNYSQYVVKKEQLRITQYHAYMNNQREIKHQEEVITKLRSFNREKSIKRADSREKLLQKIEVIDKPLEFKNEMALELKPLVESGKDVLEIEDLSKSFSDTPLLKNINLSIKRGEHIALLGANGTGKTTLLRLIQDLIPSDAGSIRLGAKVSIGYYDQEHSVLNLDKTLFDEIADTYPNLTNTQIRNTLAAFLFTNDDAFKRIKDLSGGEKGRVALAKLMLSNANFLILDEPTNHLDVYSREILEQALSNYQGTLLYVSHDRYFINKTAHKIVEIKDTSLNEYDGNYDYYLEKSALTIDSNADNISSKSQLKVINRPTINSDSKSNTVSDSNEDNSSDKSTKLDWQAQKEEQAKQRKRENLIKKTEQEIEELEARQSEIHEKFLDPIIASSSVKLQELTKEEQAISTRLESLYETWETLM